MASDPDPTRQAEPMPFGLRLAVLFLQVFGVAMILPLLLAAMPLVALVIASPFAEGPLTMGFSFCFASLGGFLLLLELVLGTLWLERHLNRRPFAFAPQWKAQPPAHPLRVLCLPALRIVAGYGLVSVCIWIASCFEGDFRQTWAWPLVWGSVGGGAFALARYLDRTLPR